MVYCWVHCISSFYDAFLISSEVERSRQVGMRQAKPGHSPLVSAAKPISYQTCYSHFCPSVLKPIWLCRSPSQVVQSTNPAITPQKKNAACQCFSRLSKHASRTVTLSFLCHSSSSLEFSVFITVEIFHCVDNKVCNISSPNPCFPLSFSFPLLIFSLCPPLSHPFPMFLSTPSFFFLATVIMVDWLMFFMSPLLPPAFHLSNLRQGLLFLLPPTQSCQVWCWRELISHLLHALIKIGGGGSVAYICICTALRQMHGLFSFLRCVL